MSIKSEISRIEIARDKIRSKLVSFGLVQSTANIDECTIAIEGIADNGSVSAEVAGGQTYTIPSGYHNGKGTVTGTGGGGSKESPWDYKSPKEAFRNVTFPANYVGTIDCTKYAEQYGIIDFGMMFASAKNISGMTVISNQSKTLTANCGNMFGFSTVNSVDLSSFNIDISNAATMFNGCRQLREIKGEIKLKLGPSENLQNMFMMCLFLEEVRFAPNCITQSLDISFSDSLSSESVKSIINGLASGVSGQTLALAPNAKNALTQDQITQITSKGWTLA